MHVAPPKKYLSTTSLHNLKLQKQSNLPGLDKAKRIITKKIERKLNYGGRKPIKHSA